MPAVCSTPPSPIYELPVRKVVRTSLGGGSKKFALGFRGEHHVPGGQALSRTGPPTRRHTVAEDPAPNNNGAEEPRPRQDVDVLLDVSELEVDRINLEVNGLKAHVSVLAELASLVSLQIGVDARLDGVKLEIEGVRAKLLL